MALPECRDRSDKYVEYLQVWDLREGWIGGAYDRTKECKLKDIAAELKLSPSTVNNHYRNGFELIVGYPYSPELWLRMLGVLKLSALRGSELGQVSRHRPLKSPSPRPVPESVVCPVGDESDRPGLVSSVADSADDRDVAELLADIRVLIKKWAKRRAGPWINWNQPKTPVGPLPDIRGRQDDFLGLI